MKTDNSVITYRIPFRFIFEQEWIFPLFIYVFGIIIGYMGITDPKSLMYAAGQQEDGIYLIYIISLMSILGLVELAANWGGRENLYLLKKHRHFILLSLSFCFLSMLFVGYHSVRSSSVFTFYLWPGIFTMGAAVSDARKRGRECLNKK